MPPDLFNLLAQSSLTGIHHVDATHLKGNRLLVRIHEQPIGVLFALGPSADYPTFGDVDQSQCNRFGGILRNPVEVEAIAIRIRVRRPIQSPLLAHAVKRNF